MWQMIAADWPFAVLMIGQTWWVWVPIGTLGLWWSWRRYRQLQNQLALGQSLGRQVQLVLVSSVATVMVGLSLGGGILNCFPTDVFYQVQACPVVAMTVSEQTHRGDVGRWVKYRGADGHLWLTFVPEAQIHGAKGQIVRATITCTALKPRYQRVIKYIPRAKRAAKQSGQVTVTTTGPRTTSEMVKGWILLDDK